MKKTNAIRLLDQQKIPYELLSYTYDENNLELAAIAQNLNLPAALIFKTLVAKGDKSGVIIALVPGDLQLHYKALSKLSENKKVSLVAVKELPDLTGYIRGGCSPIGMKKQYPVYLHETALVLDKIFINAGQRGLLIGISPSDLKKLTKAIQGNICL